MIDSNLAANSKRNPDRIKAFYAEVESAKLSHMLLLTPVDS